jgi:acetolactate synthase-1/2/3 large subunit
MPKLSEVLVETLKEAGVSVVFGIPSVHNIGLYEALRSEPSIRHILCRHEASATHMADGYARANGGVGVVITSTGPGAGYTVSPLLEAWGSCSPVLAITTNVGTDKIGCGLGALHELEDQDTLFKKVTKATFCVRKGEDVQSMTRQAVATALEGRTGPVYLEIPSDLWDREAPAAAADPAAASSPGRADGVDEAVALLREAKRPVIIAGIEAVRAGLGEEITGLAESLLAPVVTVIDAKGIIPEDHPLAFGNFARRGMLQDLFQSCDVTLALGTRLRHTVFGGRNLTLPRLIHVGWDDRWANRNHPAEIAPTGDVPTIARELGERLRDNLIPEDRREWVEGLRAHLDRRVAEVRESRAEMEYVDALRRLVPRDGNLVVDNTLLGYWVDYFYPSYKPGSLIPPRGASPIGFGFPAAMGVKLAHPDRPLVAVTGDGGFFYGAQELATCVRYGIGFPLIVVNDAAYGIIDYLQQTFYQQPYESDLNNPDFVQFAKSFGVSATRVDGPAGLEEAVARALETKEMWLIELATQSLGTPFGRY